MYLDEDGNAHMAPGCLIDPTASTTAYFWVGAGGGVLALAEDGNGLRRVVGSGGTVFLGGGGRNVDMAGSITGATYGTGSGAYTVTPVGLWQQAGAAEWRFIDLVMTFDSGAGTASISDGTDVIATLTGSTSTDGPDGTFTATTYGETNYNGGAAFTLTATFEDRVRWPVAMVTGAPTITAMELGRYSGTAWGEFENDVDPLWTLSIAGDGTAGISDGTDVVATREAALTHDPAGLYTSTTYGAENYNDAGAFVLEVGKMPIDAPASGIWYLEIAVSGGSPTGVTGPFFAATLPVNTATETYWPIAESDGWEIDQIQEGPIQWS